MPKEKSAAPAAEPAPELAAAPVVIPLPEPPAGSLLERNARRTKPQRR